MNKVKLLLDALQVESFAVESDRAGPGTVLGLQDVAETNDYRCSQFPTQCLPCLSVPPSNCGEPTCYETCPSCYVSCAYTECADAKSCVPTCDARRCVVVV